MKPTQILITVEGGVIQDISVAGRTPVEVFVIDHDNIAAGDPFDGEPWHTDKCSRAYIKAVINETVRKGTE